MNEPQPAPREANLSYIWDHEDFSLPEPYVKTFSPRMCLLVLVAVTTTTNALVVWGVLKLWHLVYG